MKRLISVLSVIVLLLCGCSEKEEIAPYDLAICDVAMSEMCEYLSSFESENYSVMTTEFSDQHIDIIISALNASSEGLNSITLYSENISEESAQKFIDFVRTKELPVTFAFTSINNEILKSYDKAFCITTNYTHAAEITAEKIKQLWADRIIIDADDNMIFTFATVKKEELSANMQNFYDTLIAGIELYGVPMQINSAISPDEVTDGNSIVSLNEANEALIVIDKTASAYINEYTPYSNGVELITISEGTANTMAETPFVLNCFIDYTDYKTAADEIVRNFNNRQYPLIDISFPVFDRTVVIPAEI
ncbi:MAG: hypothetical protein E7483_00380 [Ruminococcaceae bacterium]|nr:hypothetical protein [Oscillospiraceae bacterium]